MNQFSLTSKVGTLTSVNPRSEGRGDETVPAVDLHLSFTLPNDVLIEFGSQLRSSLYQRASVPDEQAELDGVEPVSEYPELRNPCISGPIALDFEGIGYKAIVDWGIDEASGVNLHLVKVNKVKVTPQQGGTVILQIRLQASDVDQGALGKLCTLVKSDVDLTLIPPAADDESPGKEDRPINRFE